MEYGPTALSDNELFSIITGTRDLIAYDIESLMNMDITELKSSGLSSSNANKVSAMMELSKRIWKRSLRRMKSSILLFRLHHMSCLNLSILRKNS